MNTTNVLLPNQLRELHLFAGAGGGILGGILCGHTTVCAVEWDKHARQVLLARQRDGCLPRFPIWDDVQTFDGKPWRGRVDVVCGGFPCQDISIAGKGAGIEGSRSGMWSHMARIIGEVRPRFVFVENSPMLVGRGLSVVLADLAEMGYDAKWGIVGAHHVSAPHKRDRIWILAYTDLHSDKREIDRVMGEKEREARENESLHSSSWNAIGASKHEWEHSVHGLEQVTKESCGDVSNTNLPQRKGMRFTSGSQQEYTNTMSRCSWWRQDPAEALESPVGRMAHGVANRVDRLKRIGNGQVPAVAHLAWEILSK